MADTIITNTPSPREPKDSGGGMGGWIVALLIVVIVVGGAIYLFQQGAFRAAPAGDSTNINITPPAEAPAPPTEAPSAGGEAPQ